MASVPPPPKPISTARSDSTSAITVLMSSIHCSSDGSSFGGTGSETPVPRWSNETRRPNELSRRRNAARAGSSHCASIECQNSGTRTRSGSPSPTT